MISAEEATKLTHAAECKNNEQLIEEIKEKIFKAISELKYYIVIENNLTESVKSYLRSLGYIIINRQKDILRDNSYIIRWPE